MSAISAPPEREPGTAPDDRLASLGSRVRAAVLAAFADADPGEASAINDAAARTGAVPAVAVVSVLIGVGVGSSFAGSLTHRHRSAMIVIGVVCAAGAVIAWLLVSDERGAVPTFAPPDRGCALPVVEGEATS
jgi:nitrate/nitrite transporter NarK